MMQYSVYQRDLITGHLNMIARLECSSDREAAQQCRRHAADTETLVYKGQHVVAQFAAAHSAAG